MNKYSVKLPYYYTQYGYLTGYVYAWDEEEAAELAEDYGNIVDEEYNDTDGGDTEYEYSEIDVELEEEDTEDEPDRTRHNHTKTYRPEIPEYYLSEISLI